MIAIIIRLRKGVARRDLNACGHIFVSRNPVLQYAAKVFVARNIDDYDGQAIPPVLTVGQITTAAWLATAKELDPPRVTKELLASCYNAVRPSTQWTMEFARALDAFRQENPGFIEGRANAALFLQTARNATRDDSFNQPVFLKKANIAELFTRAAEDSDAQQRAYQQSIERIKGDLQAQADEKERAAAEEMAKSKKKTEELIKRIAERAAQDAAQAAAENEVKLIAALREAEERTRCETIEHQRQIQQERIDKQAAWLARAIKITVQLVLACTLATLAILYGIDYWAASQTTKIVVDVLLGVVLLLSILDLTGWKVVSTRARVYELALARSFTTHLAAIVGRAIRTSERREPVSSADRPAEIASDGTPMETSVPLQKSGQAA